MLPPVKRFEPFARHPGVLRDNVAALVVRRDGAVLWGECADKPGWWSFPQGGVDAGETRREALIRELREEVGLPKSAYTIVASRSGYRYHYPPGKLKKGIYCGQIQTYFLCRLKPSAPLPHQRAPGRRAPEFLSLEWTNPAGVDFERIPPFKRETVRCVLRDFFEGLPA